MGLPWYRKDTNFHTHDKILELVANHGVKGKAAGFVYDCSLAQSVGAGSDGVIKKGALPFVHGTIIDARLLVEVGLWEIIDGGWRIKNFGTRQVVGAEQQAIEDSLHEARVANGQKGAAARWANA